MKNEFIYNQCFTKEDVENFPKGWLYHHEMSCNKKISSDNSKKGKTNLINQYIFIKPDIWGKTELEDEYWKDDDYHPSLWEVDVETMKNDVLLVGKIIKKKRNAKKMYETVLMSNCKTHVNYFTEDQCKKMLQTNLNIVKKTLVRNKSKIRQTNHDDTQPEDTTPSSMIAELNEKDAKKTKNIKKKNGQSSSRLDTKLNGKETDEMKDKYVQKMLGELIIENRSEDLIDETLILPEIPSSSVVKKQLSPMRNKDNKTTSFPTSKRRKENYDVKKGKDKQKIQNEKKNTIEKKFTKAKRIEKKEENNDDHNDKSDFLLHKEVAFDFHNNNFNSRFKTEMKKVTLPKNALINGRYIIGYVFERVSKKQKGSKFPNYKIGFQYSGEGMKDMIFKTEEIFDAIQLYNNVIDKKKIPQEIGSNSTLIKLDDPELKIYKFNPDDVHGDVIESDDDEDEDEMNQICNRLREGNLYFQKEFHGAGVQKYFNTDLFMEFPNKKNQNSLDINQGLIWKKNEQINGPSGIRPARRTCLKKDCRHKFRSVIESVLAFLPVQFWLYHLKQTNNYLKGSLEEKSGLNSDSSSPLKFREITFDELMIFYAIIIQLAMKPNPGSRYTESWRTDHKVWYTACNHMSKHRFQEIRAALHWCDNEKVKNLYLNQKKRKQDTLYKVRPLLSIIEKNLGKYLDPCTELSLDETCVAIRSQWARAVTFYNPNKPKGKHHLKFYTLCENSHWCALEIKMCHRFKKDDFEVKESEPESKDKGSKPTIHSETLSENSFNENEVIDSDVEDADDYEDSSDDESTNGLDNILDKDFLNQVDEIIDEEITNESLIVEENIKKQESQCEKTAQKTVQTVTSLCKNYQGSGRVINMDNLYSSPLVFIKLKEMSLYARGTVRLNRKYLPKFIQYLRRDMSNLKRGSYQFAVNTEYNMSMHCWHDKNPVHVLSTADSTTVEEVSRKQGSDKIIVQCPSTIKNYNKNMQAVDQFNKLMSLFSLCEAHTFTKYYKKIAMVLMDFVFVNSYLHHKLFLESIVSPDEKRKKKITRKQYMEDLIEALIETDWAKVAREYERKREEKAGVKKRKFGFISSEEDDKNEDDEHIFNEIDFDLVPSLPPLPDEYICQAVSFDSKTALFSLKNGAKNKSKFYCKVCQFEGRGNVRKGTVFCINHGVSLCQQVNVHPKEKEKFILRDKKIDTKDIADWKWLSSKQDEWTCWEKAHYHYIPNGLFKLPKGKSVVVHNFDSYAAFDFRSSPFLLRKIALKNTYYKKVGARTEKKYIN